MVERSLIQSMGQRERAPLSFDHLPFPERGQGPAPPERDHELPTLDETVSKHIQQALRLTKGKIYGVNGAAHLLAINPNTLRSKMKKLGIPLAREK